MRRLTLVAVFLLVSARPLLAEAAPLKVVSDFPGGSAKVENIDQEKRIIRLSPAGAAERGYVCWWYARVEGLQPGETVTLDVGGGVWATPDRAAVSNDGKEWTQTAPGTRTKDRIVFEYKAAGKEAWFAWGPPFVLADAEALVQRLAKDSPHAKTFVLCKSKDGRSVPGLRVEQEGVKDDERLGVWIQARQHAWESGGSWVGRGFIEWLLSDDARAEALRKKVRLTYVPIMDVDNVERGCGGKNQKPHDHNRDWFDKSVHPEVQAAMQDIAAQAKAGRFDVFIDLHNPGAGDKQPFFFVSPPDLLAAPARRNLDSFLQAAKLEMQGPLKLAAQAKESGPKYDPNWERISKNWVTKHTTPHVVAVTLETSWNTPHSTPDGYRRVGKEMGLALERFLREPVRQAK